MRNYSIDSLKCICAILVVFLHTSCIYSDAIKPLTRCAVPCFFMISGWFMYEERGFMEKRIRRSLRKMIWILIWSTGVYAIVKEIVGVVIHKELYVPSIQDLIDWLFFNVNPFAGHLWYISAYIYVLLLAYVINKFRLWKIIFCLVPLFLVADLMFGKYSLLIWGQEFPYYWLRNFLFVGLPYYSLGAWIKATDNQFNCKYMLIGVGVFIITSFAEYEILSSIHKNAVRDHYFSTTGLSLCLFILFLSFQQQKPNFFSRIGEKDSLYIYIFHPLFIYYFFAVINRIITYPLWLSFYSYTAPFLVLILTLLLITGLRRMQIL